MTTSLRSKGWRLVAIALLALLVRAVTPAGYMVASAESADGRYLVVQLCEGHASQVRAIDLDTGRSVDIKGTPGSPAKSQTESQPCAFAAAPAFASAVAVEGLPRLPLVVELAGVPASPDGHDRGIAAPPPPSTGPPSQIRE